MKKLLITAVASSALAASALAADLPRRGPAPAPYVAPVYSFAWSGFYAGGQLGYGWGDNTVSEIGVAGGATRNRISGFLGGAHIGANWQINQLVLGVEGDFEYSGLDGNRAVGAPFTAATGFGADFSWQGSVRGRLGYAIDRTLLYVTGGYAFANLERNYLLPAVTSVSSTRSGYVLGAGVEYAFTSNWTGRAEYRYSDFGRVTDTVAGLAYRNDIDQHAVRFGVSYKW